MPSFPTYECPETTISLIFNWIINKLKIKAGRKHYGRTYLPRDMPREIILLALVGDILWSIENWIFLNFGKQSRSPTRKKFSQIQNRVPGHVEWRMINVFFFKYIDVVKSHEFEFRNHCVQSYEPKEKASAARRCSFYSLNII